MERLKMKNNDTTGILITFCGLDGCGKTSLINALKKNLKNDYDIFLTKQPTNFVRESDIFRTYMDSPNHDAYDYRSLSLLAASDRVQHVNKVIYPELSKGRIVISDRYYYSCVANLHARGYEEDRWIYEIAQSIIKPDVSFFLDVPVDLAIERVRSRPEEKDRYIDVELQHKLRDQYLQLCTRNAGVKISTEDTFEDCSMLIADKVREAIKNKILKERVYSMLREMSGKEKIDDCDSLLMEILLESMSLVTLILRLEEEFDIEFDETDMNPYHLKSAIEVYYLVKAYIGRKENEKS